ncbi:MULTISPECIES: hypothetical protein [unclassified Polaribacter]|uniref:hypothetical protein n=1 Tax=unclassified Polaribacter TaxID=196858 RepID=UPI0011BDDD24|nr:MULTISPECIES: hypothetical protein [unclassified Polaribacter]TXD52546.1 hypothetical protein ES043_08395 [Polaribacter sp. IC063]TXD60532.1 hypothetical protein ES044_07575 [Polaribacter sp. IC066]
MKSLKINLFLVIFCLFSLGIFSQSTAGYTYHGTDGEVSLYYKVSDYDVIFRAVNQNERTVYVRVHNVSSSWSNGKTKKKTVNIGYVRSGGASNRGGLNLDNYAKLKKWSFSGWEWSTKPFNN